MHRGKGASPGIRMGEGSAVIGGSGHAGEGRALAQRTRGAKMFIVTVRYKLEGEEGERGLRIESLGPRTTIGIVADAVEGSIDSEFGELLAVEIKPL